MTEDFSTQRWRHLAAIVAAHISALGEQGSFDDDIRESLLAACENVGRSNPISGSTLAAIAAFDEHLDSLVPAQLVGAARMGRGSPEVVQTLSRMGTREQLTETAGSALALVAALHEFAAAHVVTMLPVYAGEQPLLPSTLANVIGGVSGALLRAISRIELVLRQVNESPMGAGSGASFRFTPDRADLAAKLGFDRPVENTYDAVTSVDYLGTAAEAIDAVTEPVRSLAREFELLVLTIPDGLVFAESDLIRLPDAPQARIPNSLALLSRTAQRARSLTAAVTSWEQAAGRGPQLDLDDPLIGLLEAGEQASLALRDSRELIQGGFEVNRAALGNRAGKGYLTSSDIVDFLVIEEGITPGDARLIAGRLLAQVKDRGMEIASIDQAMVDAAGLLVIGRELGIEFETLSKYLAPRRFLEGRTAMGAPSPGSTRTWLRSEASRVEQLGRSIEHYRERFERLS